jgi:PPOX class probable F420-dependent enzyme
LNRATRGERLLERAVAFPRAAPGTPTAREKNVKLPDGFLALLRKASPCFLTTLMPDGSPQTTETWVDTDGEHVIINTVQTHLKVKNIARDPRVAVAVCDATDPSRYYAVRGRVVNVTTEGGSEHIETLAQRYTGRPYAWYGGRNQVRVILTISADKIHSMAR